MNRTRSRIGIVAALAILAFFSASATPVATNELKGESELATRTGHNRPNLVFIYSDQHSYDMLGSYGNEQIVSPNLDSFAEEGTRFTSAYATSPQCTPWRGMMLSGMHPLHNGAWGNDRMLIPGKGVYFPEALKKAGYRTAYVGKWHLLGGNRNRPVPEGEARYGFDRVITDNVTTEFRAGHAFYYDKDGDRITYNVWQPEGETDHAIEFIEEVNDGEPFALFLSWHAPHNPYGTRPDLVERYYADKDVKLRESVPDRSESRKQQLREYMSGVTGIDHAFGRLMKRLKAMGVYDDTVIVFTSDHGDMLGSHGWHRWKQVPQDYSNRVPLLMRYPSAVPQGETSDLLFGAMDYMPTLLGLMGLSIPDSVQGKDLSQAIRDGDENAVESIPTLMLMANNEWRGVVTREYVFAFQGETGNHPLANVLYDRREDPYQLTNRFNDPRYADAQVEMRKLTLKWMEHFEDPFVTRQELDDSSLIWHYPEDDAETLNRTSPVEWIREGARMDR